MEFHQLEYAVAVAEAGNFTRAAARCHVTQPSLSTQVKKLERELGGPLFDRLGRKVQVTPLGERFLPHARAILLRAMTAKAAAHEVLGEIEGPVRLGVIPTIAPFWLPRVLPGLRRKLPSVQVLLREGTTDVLIEDLQRGEIDYALAAMPFDIPDLHVETLFEEEFVLALRKDHPLAQRKEIRLEDATDMPWVLLMDMHCATGQIVSFCHQRGRDVDTVFETSQVASQLGLVAAGLGVSPVPRMAARPTPGVVFVRFRTPRPTRRIVLFSHPDHFLTPAARAVARACALTKAKR